MIYNISIRQINCKYLAAKLFNAYRSKIDYMKQLNKYYIVKINYIDYGNSNVFLRTPCTWVISSGVLILTALLFKSVITASTALFIPLRKSMTFTPAAIDLQPSMSIA